MENKLKSGLADMQGKLFEMSGDLGYDSETFMKTFMTSAIAKGLDSEFDFMQWSGKEYIMERIQEELAEGCKTEGTVFSKETLYWAGYTYRWWHFYAGESSKAIYRIANAKTMNVTYFPYHTMDTEMAIERLKESKK